VAGLAGRLAPTLPAPAVFAAVAADGGGYAVSLSDDCPLDGRFEVGSVTKTFTGTVLACLTPPESAVGRAIRVAVRPHHRIDPLRSAGLGWALGPPGYLGQDGGTSGFRAMLGLHPPARRAAGVFVSDRAARGLPQAVRQELARGPGGG
jgi:hypothetical protein